VISPPPSAFYRPTLRFSGRKEQARKAGRWSDWSQLTGFDAGTPAPGYAITNLQTSGPASAVPLVGLNSSLDYSMA
jgi:hypothetical protein